MKNLFSIKVVTILFIGASILQSCQKSEVVTEEVEVTTEIQEEGFKSVTNNQDQNLEVTSLSEPLLKMHFDEKVSFEEANRQWDAAVSSYISERRKQNRDFSTEWIYRVWTFTGTQSNNDTDGDVGTYVRFTTSAGSMTSSFNWMDNFGDDREGGWDAYLFSSSFPGAAVEWVEVDYAHLYLEGTDGWFVKDFVIQIWREDQTVSATGFSNCWAQPNVWLDNNCSNTCWDSYYTGNIGSGRINF